MKILDHIRDDIMNISDTILKCNVLWCQTYFFSIASILWSTWSALGKKTLWKQVYVCFFEQSTQKISLISIGKYDTLLWNSILGQVNLRDHQWRKLEFQTQGLVDRSGFCCGTDDKNLKKIRFVIVVQSLTSRFLASTKASKASFVVSGEESRCVKIFVVL